MFLCCLRFPCVVPAALVEQIINPHTHRRFNVTREFCAAPCYASIYKRLLRDTLRKNPSLIPILSSQAPRARVAAAAAEAAEAEARAMRVQLEAMIDPGNAGSAMTSIGSARDSLLPNPVMPHSCDGRSRYLPAPVPTHLRLSPLESMLPPPPRSHPLPRGPGGIDILSGPSTPMREMDGYPGPSFRLPPPQASAPSSRSLVYGGPHYSTAATMPSAAHVAREEGTSAAVAAAAAMLGLGGSSGNGASDIYASNGHMHIDDGARCGSRGGGPMTGSSLPPSISVPALHPWGASRGARDTNYQGDPGGEGGDGYGRPSVGAGPGSSAFPSFLRNRTEAYEAADRWNARARAPPPLEVVEAGAAAEAAHWEVG